MKRDQLLIPGTFCSIPLAVLRSHRITPADKCVYAAMLNRLGDNHTVWPGPTSLAEETSLSIRKVRYSQKQLEQVGLITLQGIHSGHGTKIYSFNDPNCLVETPAEAANTASSAVVKGGMDTASSAGVIRQALPGYTADAAGVYGKLCRGNTAELATEPKQKPKQEPPQEPQQLTTPPGGATASQSSQGEATVTLDESDELDAPAPTPALTPKAYASQMIKQASKAGLEMPKTEEALRPCHANLVFCVQENPIIPFLWISIIRFLANRKGFASKSLKWITSYKTQEDGSRLFNWQMVVQWMLAADAGCLFHSLNFHWQTENFTPIHGRLADKYYDVRDKLAGKIIPRPKTLEMHPFWNSHLYLFAGSGPKRGQYCKLSTFRGNTVVEFEDGEKYVDFLRSDLLDYDAKLPPLPSQNTPQEDQLLAGLIAA